METYEFIIEIKLHFKTFELELNKDDIITPSPCPPVAPRNHRYIVVRYNDSLFAIMVLYHDDPLSCSTIIERLTSISRFKQCENGLK